MSNDRKVSSKNKNPNYQFFCGLLYHARSYDRPWYGKAIKKRKDLIDMELTQTSLFDYDYEPKKSVNLSITDDMTMKAIKTVLNLALSQNAFNEKMAQEIVDWLEDKEYYVLLERGYEVSYRTLAFANFTKAIQTLGTCQMVAIDSAKIRLTKLLNLPNNENAIINVLAHEVLHGILPLWENHGKEFKNAMEVLNKELDLDIVVRGLHGGTVKKPPYKYEVYCAHCHKFLGGYYRKGEVIKNKKRFHCNFCEGKLDIVQKY